MFCRFLVLFNYKVLQVLNLKLIEGDKSFITKLSFLALTNILRKYIQTFKLLK